MNKDNEIKNGLIIDKYGHQRWYLNSKLHRDDDLPAIEYNNGGKEWIQHGKIHRENGLPAVINVNNVGQYWEYGKQITEEESLLRKKIRDLKQELTNDLSVLPLKSPLQKI